MDPEKLPHVIYRFDRFSLDLDRGALLAADGTELPLRPKSFALLQFLVENAGRLLDRDAIMSAIWPDLFVSDDSISQCVGDIRRALGNEAQALIRTVPRRGYLFAAEVSRAEPVEPATDERGQTLPGRPQQDVIAPSSPLTLDAALEHVSALGSSPSFAAERRHLTVLLCDLVGASVLSELDDPEDLGSVMRLYRERCVAAITNSGGHIASYPGDGVLAYFGYPQAREDAAERAVGAGFAIVESTEALKPQLPMALQVRIAIASGLVINEPTGESARDQIAVGRPLNLVARLLAMAEPGTVIISDSTQRLIGRLFSLQDLGHHTFQGFSASERVWRAVGGSPVESRFEALRGSALTPLVGRNEELTLLVNRWEEAKDGEGQAVLLAGEPGIGKSRLVQALRERVSETPHVHVGCYCSPHRTHAPLQPIIAHLERAAQFIGADDPAQRLAKLEALLARRDMDVTRLGPLVGSLLSIARSGAHNLGPPQQRDRVLAELVDQFARLASHQPVLLVCEDVHWADPTSLELLGLVVDRLQNLKMLAVVTFRPEFVPPWPSHTHVTGLTLNRLSRQRCGRLVAELTGGKSLPAIVVEQIATQADGMPLFAEELTKSVLESGMLREEEDSYKLDGPLPPPTIPATLHDSLMARLDRLSSAKEIAQIAAVIGREFSHELLAAIVARDEEVAEALHRLIAAELVFRRGMGPQITYSFKHALVRDAAYASLLKGKRRELHARIATVLEKHFAQVVDAEPDVLARHWTEAGEAEKAAAYRLKAGQRALAQSATKEAIAQLTMAQEMLNILPMGAARDQRELDLQITLGAAFSAAKGLGAPETGDAFARARALCDRLGAAKRLVPVLLGLWGAHNARDELNSARTVAAQLLKLAEENADTGASILGQRALGATLFALGEFVPARAHLTQLLALDCEAAQRFAIPLPYDPYVSGRAWLALTLSVLGYPEQALAQSNESLAEADRLQHHNTKSVVLSLRCSLGQFLRDDRDVATHAAALVAVAREQGFAYWVGLGTYFQGWAHAKAGDLTTGIGEMERGLAACRTTGAQAYVPYNLALLADIYRRADEPLQARKLLDEALDKLRQTNARYCEAELLCLDGELWLAPPHSDREKAEELFQHALAIARQQQAKSVELRAALCLARLSSGGGKQRQARDILASAYAWFTEGFATEHMLEAKRFLDTSA